MDSNVRVTSVLENLKYEVLTGREDYTVLEVIKNIIAN